MSLLKEMRKENEYRGKRKDTGEFVYGSLVVGKDQVYIYDGIFHSTIVEPATVGRFIGWEDKNKSKVFVGDVVIIARYGLKRFKIIADPDGMGFLAKRKEKKVPLYRSMFTEGRVEVVCNVYPDNKGINTVCNIENGRECLEYQKTQRDMKIISGSRKCGKCSRLVYYSEEDVESLPIKGVHSMPAYGGVPATYHGIPCPECDGYVVTDMFV